MVRLVSSFPTYTPTSTPTATPIPYDLTVKVTDMDGNPVPGASVLIAGDDGLILTGETGDVSWTNLPAPDGSLEIAAQGYRASSQDFSLSRGPNELSIALERDPYGLLPSEACTPDETLVYLEDFQDSDASNLPEVQLAAIGWSVQEFAQELGNLVMVNEIPETHPHAYLQEIELDQTAVHFDYYKSDNTDIAFNFISKNEFEMERS